MLYIFFEIRGNDALGVTCNKFQRKGNRLEGDQIK